MSTLRSVDVWGTMIDDRLLSEDRPVVRLVLRILIRAALGYGIILSGGFNHGLITSVLAAVGIGLLMASPFLRWVPDPRIALALLISMAIVGALLNFQTSFAGWLLLVVAALGLLGEPQVDQRIGIVVMVVAGLINGTAGLVTGQGWSPVVIGLAGTTGVGVGAYSRRVNRQRRASEQALVQRSKELEQRSLQLIDQTEKARAETARAAALEERGRIAREMHDLLAHALGGLVVQLDAADAMLSSGVDPATVSQRLRISRQLAVDGLRDARAAVRELQVDEHAAADVDLVAAVSAITGGPVGIQIGIVLEVVGEPVLAPQRVAQAFAAVAREALTNINKHAPGARASASVIFEDGETRLEVINERGDGEEGELAATGSGFGTQTMARRMSDIGGSLTAGRSGDRRWMVVAQWHDQPEAATDGAENRPEGSTQ